MYKRQKRYRAISKWKVAEAVRVTVAATAVLSDVGAQVAVRRVLRRVVAQGRSSAFTTNQAVALCSTIIHGTRAHACSQAPRATQALTRVRGRVRADGSQATLDHAVSFIARVGIIETEVAVSQSIGTSVILKKRR